MIPSDKHPVELRIFPNQKWNIGHSKENIRLNYLFGEDGETLKNRKGVYRVHTVKPLHRIRVGTIALFRYEDKLLGEGKISKDVHYLKHDHWYFVPGMEGYVEFDTTSLHPYPNKPSLEEIERITGKFPGKRNSWTIFGLHYLDEIREVGGLNL
ncbi:MAG: hypothetical protein ACYDAO_05130 [Thermoplasmataceae archaeon]